MGIEIFIGSSDAALLAEFSNWNVVTDFPKEVYHLCAVSEVNKIVSLDYHSVI